MLQTFSLTLNGITHHLISYYKIADVSAGRLRTPSSLPELAALDISPEYLEKTHFRCPPRVELGRDGRLRYRGEGDEGGNSGSGERGSGHGHGSNAGAASGTSGRPSSSSGSGAGYGSSGQMTITSVGGNGVANSGSRYASHPQGQALLSLESGRDTTGHGHTHTHDFPGHMPSPSHTQSSSLLPSSEVYPYPPHPHEVPHALPLGPSHGSPQYSRRNRADRRYDPYANSFADANPVPHPHSLPLATGAGPSSGIPMPLPGRTVKKVRKRGSVGGKASESSGSSVSPVAVAVAGSSAGSGSYAPHQQMQQYPPSASGFGGYTYPASSPTLSLEPSADSHYYTHSHGHMGSPHVGPHSLHHSLSLPHGYYSHSYDPLGAGSGVRERPRTPPPLPSIAGSAAPTNPIAGASSSPAMTGSYAQSPSPVHMGYYNTSHSSLGGHMPSSNAGAMWGPTSSGHGHQRTHTQSSDATDPVMGSLPPMGLATEPQHSGVRKIEEEERFMGGHMAAPAPDHGHGFMYERRPQSAFGGLNSAGSASAVGMGMGVPL